MTNRTRRDKRRRNKDKFIFTNDLSLNKPYVDYHNCIENLFLGLDPTMLSFTIIILVLLYFNTKIFAL